MDASTEYELPLRGLLRLPAGSHLACDSGAIWVTEDHQAYDAVLEPGQRFHPVGQGALLVYALTPARLHRLQ
ncbi:DUF2917 domain-containing protein [Pseudorhodoferax sp.]|uniref:DUF2917 domain-containing protein n=1 Tax=Pseudorhodoferax sp. TaxID=1993553 RepID=UPI002DD6687B|nr:DUF2917 domain-containing protein [Pseudorhodoferax sp.]